MPGTRGSWERDFISIARCGPFGEVPAGVEANSGKQVFKTWQFIGPRDVPGETTAQATNDWYLAGANTSTATCSILTAGPSALSMATGSSAGDDAILFLPRCGVVDPPVSGSTRRYLLRGAFEFSAAAGALNSEFFFGFASGSVGSTPTTLWSAGPTAAIGFYKPDQATTVSLIFYTGGVTAAQLSAITAVKSGIDTGSFVGVVDLSVVLSIRNVDGTNFLREAAYFLNGVRVGYTSPAANSTPYAASYPTIAVQSATTAAAKTLYIINTSYGAKVL